jgi:hypothetical protein
MPPCLGVSSQLVVDYRLAFFIGTLQLKNFSAKLGLVAFNDRQEGKVAARRQSLGRANLIAVQILRQVITSILLIHPATV